MATLNIQHVILSFDDDLSPGNPLRRFIDWTRRVFGIAVNNPHDKKYFVPANSSLSIFNGTRATSIDGTTQFSLTKNPLLANTYRFSWVAGTNPVLRTDRGLNLTGLPVAMVVNGDGTQTMTVTGGTNPLAAVQIGDNLFIPGASTGDGTSLFNPANEGLWTVLVNGNSSIVIGRLGAFSGLGETQTPTSAPQVLAFSSTGIQIGDGVDVTAVFAPTNFGSYTISQVTSKWFEVTSTRGLAVQSNIAPGVSGIQWYTALKRWVRVEVDQEAVVQFNGDTSNLNRVSPVAAGDKEQTGWNDKFGAVYSLTIVNRSAVTLNALVQSAE